MIVSIKGILNSKNSSDVIIDVNGMGYQCSISAYTYEQLPNIGEEVFLNTFLQVTENSHSLYGFINSEEKALFEMLISINGIGPKTVMPILSSARPDDVINRIVSGDVSMLSSLPGIGTKTAKRIIIELKDKLSDYSSDDIPELADGSIVKDTLNALSSLGYSGLSVKREVDKIILNSPNIKIEELIKKTLNQLK
tara:strand:- start:566 stop:1150 length:585 start_codon:yes stop_codon:yes gene_type:complete